MLFSINFCSYSNIQRFIKSTIRKRQWLFHAMDFQSLMYPCFTICRICGIFPYKIKASTFEFSKLYYIVLSVFAVLLILIYHTVISISTQNFEVIITGISNINYLVLNYFILMITLVLSGPQMRLLQLVRNLSETFLEVISENVQINSRQKYFQYNPFFPARKHL